MRQLLKLKHELGKDLGFQNKLETDITRSFLILNLNTSIRSFFENTESEIIVDMAIAQKHLENLNIIYAKEDAEIIHNQYLDFKNHFFFDGKTIEDINSHQ